MILKSLELQGFKTFPDKTTLSFEPGVTSVVGPNGSGKSNISDAIRWVLGEQSVRTLRCSKMEDVIFGGTPQRKAMGYAEVTLTIDNHDGRLPFESDTVAVTRRYYRSGESEYLINKATVRLKDVNELFMDTGLGRDGYSVIGQGKIDSIVAARSEDRREIFEEAAGISRYRYRKEESERRLNRAEENLVRLRDILGELEARVEPLRVQAEKAEKFLTYSTEKKGLEIGIWLTTLERSGKVLREHSEKIDLMRARHNEIEEELEQIAAQIEENFRKTGDCTGQMELARNEAAAFDEQALRVEGEIELIRNDISHDERDCARLNEQLTSAKQSDQETEREIAEKERELSEKTEKIEESREKLLRFTERLEELRRGADEATRKMEQAAVEQAQRAASLSEERVRLSSAQSSMQEIQLRAGAVEETAARLLSQLSETEQEGRELAQMLSDTEKAIAAGENTVKGYELRLDSRRKRAETAKAEMERLMLDTNEQLRRAKLLEDLERNLEGFGQSVKVVMKEAGRGLLSGICGPVSRILKVPGEYAVALETALGGAMQNIVVETEQDAKSAINLLKRKESGRATFLPLTNIRGNRLDERELDELPGYVGIAANLCGCEKKYEGIKDSLLGRVAVAEDLDSAVAIAKRTHYKFRVVSLDGQVVNAGGSLTGGAKARNSGLLGRASEIQKIRERAAELQQKTDAAQETYRERQNELAESTAELEQAKAELSSLGEERIKILSECSRVQRECEQLKRQSEDLERERADSTGRLRELQEREQAALAKIQELEAENAEAEQNSELLAGARAEQQQRCDDIAQTIQEIRLSEFSAQKDRDTLQAGIAALRARQADSAGAAQRLHEELAALEQRKQELTAKIDDCKTRCETLRAQAEEKRKSVETIAAGRAELEQQAAQLRQKERDTGTERENVGHELARLQERSDNLQKEYDSIITKLWEEYELTRREAEEIGTQIDDLPAAQRRLSELKNSIRALGSVNVAAVEEYKEVSERYEFMKTQITDVEQSKAELLKLIDDLTKHMKEQFTERFAEINRNFGSIFKELFGGGAAELSFTDPSDVLRSGIEIKVQPPGKIVAHIESLSGGEKALVAISIYFAIMRVNPPPFCVLDEIEAALDDVNVNRFSQYLRRMSDRSQLIAITHRRGTMEGSDMLYGVTMQDEGVSKLLALKTEEAEAFGT